MADAAQFQRVDLQFPGRYANSNTAITLTTSQLGLQVASPFGSLAQLSSPSARGPLERLARQFAILQPEGIPAPRHRMAEKADEPY